MTQEELEEIAETAYSVIRDENGDVIKTTSNIDGKEVVNNANTNTKKTTTVGGET